MCILNKIYSCVAITGVTLDGVQVYNTCADPKIKQSLEDFISEKVPLKQRS